MGDTSYLVEDLRLPCAGPAYAATSVFNACFVLLVVCGWPGFITWYLRKVIQSGRSDNPRVRDRIGFLYTQYKVDYLYWDVIETVRKLYLVTVVRHRRFRWRGQPSNRVGCVLCGIAAA